MYDEFERAVTGRPAKAGMSVLGWLAAAFGFVLLVGVVGAGFAITRAVHKAKDVAWDLAHGLDAARAGEALAELDARTASILSMEPEAGLAYLQDLGSGDPGGAFVSRVGEGAFEPFREMKGLLSKGAAAAEGRRPAEPGRGDVRIDLDRTDEGGSLVIDAGGEQLRFDLRRTGSGGALQITSADGTMSFDASGGDNGGRLVITSDHASVKLGVGDEAVPVPGWVPLFEGISGDPQPVISLESDAGVLGAVAWEGSAPPSEILGFYRSELEARGYDLQDQMRRTAEGVDEGSFWARNGSDGTVVFVVARHQDGKTGVLLGYGQER